MHASVRTVVLAGLDPVPVLVECSTTPGLPGLRLVGLPDATVREAADRVRSAFHRANLPWPQSRVTVGLSPAQVRKSGAGFDLPIAAALLAATGVVPTEAVDGLAAIGELGLDGEARPVPGLLPAVAALHARGAGRIVVPAAAVAEAALVEGAVLVPVADLAQLVAILRDGLRPDVPPPPPPATTSDVPDLSDVRGQHRGRRALEVAAAGGHHLLLSGPPGCGKTLLATRLAGLLPPLDAAAALEVAAVHSAAGQRDPAAPLDLRPPLRAPHHSTTVAGLVGGGPGLPRPGALSCAHRGVLFLDELLELPRVVLDQLREPLESGRVTLTRAAGRVRFPACVQLVAATNPCPCGDLGRTDRSCRCRPDRVERYRARLSGPLLDRIDLQLDLPRMGAQELLALPPGEATAVVAERVARARDVAIDRDGVCTGALAADRARQLVAPAALRGLVRRADAEGWSARAVDRTIRVARTVADLDGATTVHADHVDEASGYRLAAVPA